MQKRFKVIILYIIKGLFLFMVHARYPDGLKLIEDGRSDMHGNNRLLVYENDTPAIDAFFDGVVYISPFEYEVYQLENGTRKTGMFTLSNGVDWNARTPRQVYDEGYKHAREMLINYLHKIEPACICEYPRITDYLVMRSSDDQRMLDSLITTFLIQQSGHQFLQDEEELYNYTCPKCSSTYQRRYRERGIDQLSIITLSPLVITGQPARAHAPSYLQALFDEVFKRNSLIYRQNLYAAGLDDWLDYLFAKK